MIDVKHILSTCASSTKERKIIHWATYRYLRINHGERLKSTVKETTRYLDQILVKEGRHSFSSTLCTAQKPTVKSIIFVGGENDTNLQLSSPSFDILKRDFDFCEIDFARTESLRKLANIPCLWFLAHNWEFATSGLGEPNKLYLINSEFAFDAKITNNLEYLHDRLD